MIVCFLCKKKEKLKTFCDKTFQKCTKAIQIRNGRGMKYGDLLLTKDNKSEYGYHLECYKRVTALKRKYQDSAGYDLPSSSVISPEKQAMLETPIDDTLDLESLSGSVDDPIAEPSSSVISPEKQAMSETPIDDTLDPESLSGSVDDPIAKVLSSMMSPIILAASGPSNEDILDPKILDDNVQDQTAEPSISEIHVDMGVPDYDPKATDDDDMESEVFAVNQSESITVMFPDLAAETSSDQQTIGQSCIFCKQRSKRVGSRREFVITSTDFCVDLTKKIATEIQDVDLCEYLDNCEKFYYHRTCMKLYEKKIQKTQDVISEHSNWFAKRKVHAEAYESLKLYIKQEIIDNEKIMYLNDLLSRYKAILYEIDEQSCYGQSQLSFDNYNAQHLESKILKTFEESIIITRSDDNLKKKIVYRKNIDVQSLINQSVFLEQNNGEIVRNTAFEVRKSVISEKKQNLPQNLQTKDIVEGECEISQLLYTLVSSLVQGPDVRRQLTKENEIKINSVCQDLIYIIHNGQVKPAKHLKLGLAIKSLTNSRKVLTILNRLGHCVSYPVAESLETELTYSATETNQLIPSGIYVEKGHSTHLAFDNYDRHVETRTGKDTLHDTVGIIYQFPSSKVAPKEDESSKNNPNLDKLQFTKPPDEDVLLIDGFFFLRKLGPLPETFREISEFILRKMCRSEAKEVHLIFDKYIEPSIKEVERNKRNRENTPYQISGPTQKRPQDFLKSLNNVRFKEALINFLISDWERDELIPIIGIKKIYVTKENLCFSFKKIENKLQKIEETEYFCTHEEADTRLIFHMFKIQPESKVLVNCSDTDILVIIIGNIHQLTNCSQIWIYNTQLQSAYSCTELAHKLGPEMCKALPAAHAYTGCDYTSAFKGKGKIKAFHLIEADQDFRNVFASLNSPEDIQNKEKIQIIQKFTCKLYSSPKSYVNQARFEMLTKKYGNITQTSKFMKKIINFNAAAIPPCWRSLKQHLLRTLLVSSMWRNATKQSCFLYDPIECGWVLNSNNNYDVLWYEGDPTPLHVNDIISVDKNESDESDISCDSSSDEE